MAVRTTPQPVPATHTESSSKAVMPPFAGGAIKAHAKIAVRSRGTMHQRINQNLDKMRPSMNSKSDLIFSVPKIDFFIVVKTEVSAMLTVERDESEHLDDDRNQN